MRKNLLVAGIAAAALIPSFAMAQTCEQQRNQRVVGTVAGAGIGALAGGAVAGHDDRTKGAVIGGLAGALLGNQLTKGNNNGDCAHAYGYYDQNGMWHATGVSQSAAQGYYDRNGAWVAGAPNGHYDSQGRWISASTSASAAGYYDREGRWVPASASGYYDQNGQWIAGTASGYYSNGRWVAGPATGHYDANGRWISGQPLGHRDANGVWVADAQPGYYDTNGRWRAGPAMGYYDTRGQWIATAPSAGGYSSNATYQSNGMWADAPRDVRARISWLNERIQRGAERGTLNRNEARTAMAQLETIRRDERRLPHPGGQLRERDQMALQERLDRLSSNLRWANRN